MTYTLPRRLGRTEHTSRRVASNWTCMPCVDSGYVGLDSSLWGTSSRQHSSRRAFRPTDSQAMGYAIALAAEYVRAAERFPTEASPEVDTPYTAHSQLPLLPDRATTAPASPRPDSTAGEHDMRVPSRPLLLLGGLGLSTCSTDAVLTAPMRSTRSRRDRSRTASGGSDASTLCNSPFTIVEKLPGRPRVHATPLTPAGLRDSLK
ncbi:hypothetical protein LPJ61_002497, partial [Coemansia biformis]